MMSSEKPTLTQLLESTKNLIDNIKLYLDDSSESPDNQAIDKDEEE